MVTAPSYVCKILDRLQDVEQAGSEWKARCPAHDDRKASLTIRVGDNGRVLMHCHAGCAFDTVRTALGMKAEEFNSPSAPVLDQVRSNGSADRKKIVTTYDYTDEAGELLFQAVRFYPKEFSQRCPDPNGRDGWTWSLKGVRRVLYRLPELRAAIERGETIFFVEGEKDADSLRGLGFTATCNPMGAGKWDKEYNESLQGARLVLLPDNDDPGRAHVEKIAQALHGVAASLQRIDLPGLPEKGTCPIGRRTRSCEPTLPTSPPSMKKPWKPLRSLLQSARLCRTRWNGPAQRQTYSTPWNGTRQSPTRRGNGPELPKAPPGN